MITYAIILSLQNEITQLHSKYDKLQKALGKTQSLLVSTRKERDEIQSEWEEETDFFNRGWGLAESGKVPKDNDPAPVWDGYRSRKYSTLIEEAKSLKKHISDTMESGNMVEEGIALIDLKTSSESMVGEIESLRSRMTQQDEEIVRLQGVIQDLYKSASQLDEDLRGEQRKALDSTLKMEALANILVSYRRAVLFGPNAKLLLSNLIAELGLRNMSEVDLASLLRIEIPVAKALWEILGQTNV